MLGRKNYTREEIDHAKAAMAQQFAAYRQLAESVDAPASDSKAASALADFEPLVFNNLALALDRYFVHRVRAVTGKDGNALNELELITDSLMSNDGVLRTGNVITYVPEQSVLKLDVGDPIRIGAAQFERLSAAVFAELEQKFL